MMKKLPLDLFYLHFLDMGSDIRSIFSPGIHKYIENLLRQGKIGICAGTLRLLDVNTG